MNCEEKQRLLNSSPQDDGGPPQPGVGRQLLDHELSDIGARYLAAVNACEVGGGPDAATRRVVGKCPAH
jgi:hypothetical protein